MHRYGKAVGDVEQINFQMQQPMVALQLNSFSRKHSPRADGVAKNHPQV